MENFEDLLRREGAAVARFVRFRIQSAADADDVLQEVYLTAYQKFFQLKSQEAFKSWLISIARNKCNNYFCRKSRQLEIPMNALTEQELTDSCRGISAISVVRETLDALGDKDKQILYLYFWKEMPQMDIAAYLNIPVGTVKSRLHTAKRNFKNHYPYDFEREVTNMKKMPEHLPEYKIAVSEQPSFAVKWEELMGWFLVPRLGEKLSWAMYDMPSRKCSHVYDLQVTGKARVHGIEGVELNARETPYSANQEVINRTFVAQLTDTHCRYLAAVRTDNGVRNYITFLDGEDFTAAWGFGEDNIGSETNLAPKGEIHRSGNVVTTADRKYLLDIVGRYNVAIDGKTYDTVCVMELDSPNCDVVIEQFLDKNGKTILWRRFNRDDWAFDRYRQKWTDLLPQNDRLTVNGTTYVHWYDCITDYVL